MSMEDFVKTLNDEQKQALLSALNNNSPTIEAVPEEVKEKTKQAINNSFITESKQSNIKQQRRREPVKAKKNMWEDTGECRDVETPDYERTPRKRKPLQKKEVECHACGKPFKVDARFLFGEYYRCNRCASRR